MDLKILIATPVASFGELVTQSLKDAGYIPIFVTSTAQAILIARDEQCPIAILDCNLQYPGTAQFAEDLHSQIENLNIIFVNLDESCERSINTDFGGDIELPKPFYLPDLMETIEKLAAENPFPKIPAPKKILEPETNEIPADLGWLQDVNQAAQYLTRLSLGTNAQAALIIRGDQIWAYAGQLAQSAAEELAQFVDHHWANGDGRDLARFIRLETTGQEYMLYATYLGAKFVLALSFEAEMPFSEMRAQTGKLARRLTSPPGALPPQFAMDAVLPEMSPHPEPADLDPIQWVSEDDYKTDDAASAAVTDADTEDWDLDDAMIERQRAMFEDLLATLDIPNPDGSTGPYPVEEEPSSSLQLELQTQEPETDLGTREEAPLLMDTRPTLITPPLTRSEVQLEPESPTLHDLAFACVLLPRLPGHHLTGVLNELLNLEMVRLCLAFGWRLEHLAIRPQYLHWVVSVGPDVPASQVIEGIRYQTSDLIFKEFPRLARENPSGDFWASGFMVINGRRSLAGGLIQEFIQQTRTRQGLEHAD
jgi:CheY-like chemotaxis protein/REP element-mobilizing transposase RayT